MSRLAVEVLAIVGIVLAVNLVVFLVLVVRTWRTPSFPDGAWSKDDYRGHLPSVVREPLALEAGKR